MALTDPGPGIPPRPDYSHELDPNVDPKQVRKGAAIWGVIWGTIGILCLYKAIGGLGMFGVLALGIGIYFAAIHAIYDKINHFQQAVLLWNEMEQMVGGKTQQAGGIAWNSGPAPHEVCEECGGDNRPAVASFCTKKGCPYQRGGP